MILVLGNCSLGEICSLSHKPLWPDPTRTAFLVAEKGDQNSADQHTSSSGSKLTRTRTDRTKKHLVSSPAARWSSSLLISCSSVRSRKVLTMACRPSRRCLGRQFPAVSKARAAERTRRRSGSSSCRTPSSQPCGAANSSASCCLRTPSCTLDAAWQLVHSSSMSWELWSFISAGKWRLYSCGTMFFLQGVMAKGWESFQTYWPQYVLKCDRSWRRKRWMECFDEAPYKKKIISWDM